MACTQPLNAWRRPEHVPGAERFDPTTGEVLEDSRPLFFSPVKGYEQLTVPCGKCDSCLMANARIWAIRAYHESTLHKRNCFVTLTYDQDNMPADGKLCPRDVELWLKRLRKRPEVPPIRYLLCGEYGDLTHRPHYHALVFGADFMDSRAQLWKDDQYIHPTLTETWEKGLVTHAELSFERCAYVAGYVVKKIGAPEVFRRASRRPGIGASWSDRYRDSVSNLGHVVIDGQKLPVPQYYIDRHDLQEVRDQKKEFAINNEVKQLERGQRAILNARRVNAKQKAHKRKGSL